MTASTIYSNSQREADRLFFTPSPSISTGIPNSSQHSAPAAFYYLVSEHAISGFGFESNIIKATDFIYQNYSLSIHQFDTIAIASLMFGDCRPLEGKPLEILKKTARRVLSSKPTHFPRN